MRGAAERAVGPSSCLTLPCRVERQSTTSLWYIIVRGAAISFGFLCMSPSPSPQSPLATRRPIVLGESYLADSCQDRTDYPVGKLRRLLCSPELVTQEDRNP